MVTKTKKIAFSIVVAIIFFATVFWGSFQVVADLTSSTEFCISCHEMENTVYQEYLETPHYKNASGVRAGCSDCHVPREGFPKLARKILAVKDIYHTLLGTVDTPEKFEAKRLEMAETVWASMEQTDSRECRACHSFDAMDFHKQQRRSAEKMQKVIEDKTGETCIDCHKGLAHKLPEGYDDDD